MRQRLPKSNVAAPSDDARLAVANYNNHDTDAWWLALDTVSAAKRQPLPYVID
jgi:hypothetical protein